MGHEENYCIWSGSSIGGCPLEEASEQERIPSKCKVAREVVGGPRGPIVIIVEVIQCKVD
jgi:hypothetical protein